MCVTKTSMIHSHELSKNFVNYKKEPGIMGSLKSFFHRTPLVKNAVNNFDLDIRPGEFVGLLGPNGAGKTTLMKMLTGIIVPSSGELNVLGYKPHERDKNFRKKIALVMGQKSQLWWDIPAMDSLHLLQTYYEVPEDQFKKRIQELSDVLDVSDYLHIHVRKLSLGERMKLELIACLLHDPEVIFLDEPTIGLDLISQNNIREFLLDYQRRRNCTIVLTSHYMTDVEALCKRIVLVLKGQKAYDGSIEDFQTILGSDKAVRFSFTDAPNISDTIWSDLKPQWSQDNKQVQLLVPQEQLRQKSREILDRFTVNDFHSEKVPIERVMSSLSQNPELLINTSGDTSI